MASLSVVSAAPERIAFTSVLGGYEPIRFQPMAEQSSVRFVCFTDDVTQPANGWELVAVDAEFPRDLVRSQRALKILGHPLLADYDEWLYIDNSVTLKRDPAEILHAWLDGADYACARHSFREELAGEFDAVIQLGYDDAARVTEQLWAYALECPGILQDRPVWNGLFARRNTPEVAATMRIWFDHVLRYSRRDQLSILYALQSRGFELRLLDFDNSESEWHEWRIDPQRKVAMGKVSPLPIGPLLVEAQQARARTRDIEAKLRANEARIGDLEGYLADAQDEAARLRELTAAVHLELESSKSRALDVQSQLDAVTNSKLWRWSHRLRRLGREQA